MSKTVYMRGLQVFISDIRAATNKEAEQKRVEKELSKIRAKFGEDKALTGYDRRKYIWKLLYIYMLGYDIEFGHRQACDLIPASKYSDKQVGYMACSLLLRENDEFLRLAINGIHMDLTSRNEAFHCLALGFAGNMAGQEMADALLPDVVKLLQSGSSRPIVKKKAALCLLRLLRKSPLDQTVIQPDTFCSTVTGLLEERDLGLLLSSITLLYGICIRTGAVGYEPCQSRVIRVLERLVANKDVQPDYTYYGLASPWLQCKCLRMLQFFPAPEGNSERKVLSDCLGHYINRDVGDGGHKPSNPNKANAQNGMLFEAIALALHLKLDKALLTASVNTLGKFLGFKDPNIKYLALENMARLALMPDILDAIRVHKATVLNTLKDADISIRRRGVDLLFIMCDERSADDIVNELLKNVTVADSSMREELVLKIAILAEKFAPSVQWYVDIMLQLLERAGEHVGEEIWHRVVQLVAGHEAMQPIAARNAVDVLRRGASHESLVSVAAYVLGEYGRLIVQQVTPLEQHKVLYSVFPAAMQNTKGLLLTAFIKIYLLDPHNVVLKRDTLGLFEKYKKFMDLEVQQRAAEYLAISSNPASASTQYILPMPAWQDKQTALLTRLQRHEGVEGIITDTPLSTSRQHSKQPDADGGESNGALAPALAPALRGGAGGQPPSQPSALPQAYSAAPPPPAPPQQQQMPHSMSMGPQPSMDLISTASMVAPAPYGAPPRGPPQQQQQYPAPPPPPPQPVDLLADLFSDGLAVSSSTAPPPLQYGAPPPLVAASSNNPFAAPPPTMYSAPPPAMYGGAPPPMYGAPPPAADSANPFAAAAPSLPPPQAAAFRPHASASQASGGLGSGFSDPFGDHAFGAPAAAPPPPVEPPKLAGDLQQWYQNLLFKDRGILYEDQYLQVGVQSRYGRGRGDVVLFFGNKHAELELSRILCSPVSTQALMVSAGSVPHNLGPKQQLQVPLQVVALAPFDSPALLQLGYTVGGLAHQQELRLPVANHRFMVPEPGIAREVFFEQWRLLGSAPQKAQEMVERSAPLASEACLSLLRGVNLGAERGYLDPSPNNEAGAAQFVTGGQPEQAILVLCRLEGNPQTRAQFRVTVSSASPVLSASIKDVLAQQVKMAV